MEDLRATRLQVVEAVVVDLEDLLARLRRVVASREEEAKVVADLRQGILAVAAHLGHLPVVAADLRRDLPAGVAGHQAADHQAAGHQAVEDPHGEERDPAKEPVRNSAPLLLPDLLQRRDAWRGPPRLD